MNAIRKTALTLSLLTALCAMPVQAKELGDGLYQIDRYDVFTLFDTSGYPHEKRVVTEIAGDGTFRAENVSDFLQSTGLYEITEVQTETDVQGEPYERELCYTFLPEQAREGYWEEEQLTPLFFSCIVSLGDVIKATDDETETVTSLGDDGCFYTEVTKIYPLESETE